MPDARPLFPDRFLFPSVRVNSLRLERVVKGKTILITGASYGIGEQLALQPEQVAQLTLQLCALPDGIDIVVSNAGRSIRRPLMESLDRNHDFTRTMALNYAGPVQLLLGLIPVLQARRGHIINVSTVGALLAPAPYWAAYQASKTAFDSWLRSAGPELEAVGVRTSSVYLPLVRTRMIAPTAMYDNMPAMTAAHAARAICRCMQTRQHKYAPWWLIFGQLASVLLRRPYEYFAARYLKQHL
jgi:NAD(P)-dependent dehydrogenase (short-subunit alcohol dehydrogenase family)